AEVAVLAPSGIRRTTRYIVRVEREGQMLARQTGLLDARGRPVRGMPPFVVGGATVDAEAAWRGAFLARGSLTEPGRSSALELSCPGPEVALAMVGAARRLGVASKAREVRGTDRVVLRDGDAISALLTRMGAHQPVRTWGGRRPRGEVRASAPRWRTSEAATCAGPAGPRSGPGRGGKGARRISGERSPSTSAPPDACG